MQVTRHYWMYAPGEQANRWEEFRSKGVMALGYGEGAPNDLRTYKTEADLVASFQSAAGDDASHKNAVRALVDFRDKMKVGDLVFAKKGQKKIVGIGRVTGEYEYSKAAPDMRHRRRVEWFDTRERILNDKAPIKTLTDITDYPAYLVKLANACDVDDLYSEAQYRMWDEAVQRWPVAKLKAMSLDEYNAIGSKTSFCYFIEKTLEDMGSVWGGSSYKFGIFEYNKDDPKPLDAGSSGDAKYRWYSKYGTTAVEAFETVRTRIVAIAESSAKGDYPAIDDIDFSPAIKWKIAFIYQKRESMGVADIFKKEMMMQAVGESNADTAMSQLYARAFAQMQNAKDVFVWSRQAWRKIGEEKDMSEDLRCYRDYLEKQSQGSGKVASYLTVIKKIGEIVNKINGFQYVPKDFSSIKNLDLLWKVYVLVNEEQKKPDGGFFKGSSLSKSYWDSRHGFCSAAVRSFLNFRIETYNGSVPELPKVCPSPVVNQTAITGENFAAFIQEFISAVKKAGLIYDDILIKRFVCALLAKPFVVLTGLSGSGKTKLAQIFTQWIATQDMYRIVPVGADWTNSEKLLGYPNALDPNNYILPDTGVLKLMIDANDNPTVPFFLILDEMNLSHVERYFADFLSAMESEGSIKLYDGKNRTADDGTPVPPTIPFPKNLFVIGTMNVDETTHAFSPKVLDRAQVIEFRVNEKQINAFLDNSTKPDLSQIDGKGVEYAAAFLKLHDEPLELADAEKAAMSTPLKNFFPVLAELSSEFAFRTASEALKFCGFARKSVMSEEETVDAAIMQKLLPKLHGSRRRLAASLEAFWGFCRKDGKTQSIADVCKKDATDKVEDVAKFPVSAEKIRRLYKAAEQNGFASYAEA